MGACVAALASTTRIPFRGREKNVRFSLSGREYGSNQPFSAQSNGFLDDDIGLHVPSALA